MLPSGGKTKISAADHIAVMKHIHPPVMLYPAVPHRHPISNRHILRSNVRISNNRTNFPRIQYLKRIFFTRFRRFQCITLMPVPLLKKSSLPLPFYDKLTQYTSSSKPTIPKTNKNRAENSALPLHAVSYFFAIYFRISKAIDTIITIPWTIY